MAKRRGSDVLLEVLATEKVEHVFGNPGTTELPLLGALPGLGSPSYVLGLHESVCIGMADGYARASGRASFVNLHTAAGLGNAMGLLSNAVATRTPMVVTAGQQDQRHLFAEPFLSGNLAPLAGGLVKCASEVHRVEDLGPALRRAFRAAESQPPGPVFVSIPMDLLMEETDSATPPRSSVTARTVPAAIAGLAERIKRSARARFAVVAGEEVAASGAVEELVLLAEALGCVVFGAPMHSALVFPFGHPQWGGALPADAGRMHDLLGRYDTVLAIGARPFMTFMYRDSWPIPATTELLHLSPFEGDLGRTYSAALGLVGDPRTTLEALLALLTGLDEAETTAARTEAMRLCTELHALAAGHYRPSVDSGVLTSDLHPAAVVDVLMGAFPSEMTVVDEGVTNDPYVRSSSRASRPGSFLYSRGGGLGWGVPAAMGVSLATDRSPVAAVVGDGSFLYSPQALWTAVHERLPVVAFVLNNGGYLILKRLLAEVGVDLSSETPTGLDIAEPLVDIQAIASGFGARSIRVSALGDIREAVNEALSGDGPFLVEIPVSAEAAP